MRPRIVLAPIVAVAAFTLPAVSHAGTGCKSTWVKANGKVAKFFAPAAKLVCKKLNTKDEAKAKKCIADVEKFAADAERIRKEWNAGENGGWKIGPRALPTNRTQSGKVSTERQFVGAPVLTETYKIAVKRTGGKAKKDLVVRVCMVDENGDDVRPPEVVRLNAKKRSAEFEFRGVPGTMAMVHLNNQRWGANAHRYTITATGSGEPAAVKQARDTLAKSKGKGKRGG